MNEDNASTPPGGQAETAAVPSAASRAVAALESALTPVRALSAFGTRHLHPLRRARALRALGAVSPVRSVLFVCQGNVCRSPFAAVVLAQKLREAGFTAIEVHSTGFVGIRRAPPSAALSAAARLGYDMSAHRASFIKRPMVDDASVVVVMQASQKAAIARRFHKTRSRVIVLGDLDPVPCGKRTIRDPIGRADAVFQETFDRIERCVAELARVLIPVRRPRRTPVPRTSSATPVGSPRQERDSAR
jgi:protein-tyrosine phosphatase